MKALEHSGEEFSQGNILSGLWSGTMGVIMGALVDVMTLGGSVSPDEGADILSSSAQDYNSAKAQGNSSTAALSTALSSASDRMAQANQNSVDDANTNSYAQPYDAGYSTPTPATAAYAAQASPSSSHPPIKGTVITADGFDFQIIQEPDPNYPEKMEDWVIGAGGPCRPYDVDYIKMYAHVAATITPSFLQNYDLYVYPNNVSIKDGRLGENISPPNQYGRVGGIELEQRRARYEDAKRKGLPDEYLAKATYERGACLVDHGSQYAQAVYNWATANKALLMRTCKAMEKRNKISQMCN